MVLCTIFILAVATAGYVYKLYRDQDPVVMELKDKLKIFLCDIKIPALKDEESGAVFGETLYEDAGKKTVATESGVRLLHYASGYYMDLPEGSQFDFSVSPSYVKIKTPDYNVTVSREYSTEPDVTVFIDQYLDGFLLNESYRAANEITLLSPRTRNERYDIYSARLDGYEEGYDGYTYVDIFTDTRIFYRLTFKFDSERFEDISDDITSAVESFHFFRPKGEDSYTVKYQNRSQELLTGEAKRIYADIQGSEHVRWGLFTEDVYDTGINKTIPHYEELLDYKFSVVLGYMQFGDDFPTDFAEKCYENGKVMLLTYQATRTNNVDLLARTPQLDILRGREDQEIRQLARAAADFGKPFLFRLGNEMNSDWTSYSGVVNMIDPEVYVAVWQRMYRIFMEEGATNAIWVYNPNDKCFPPCNWNDIHAYYPGDEYVQLIGVTGYNTGTYYAETNKESWREFDDIYGRIQREYSPFFSDFPWIITEFASSSIGGDKAAWIDNMFRDIDGFENIKVAVWFDYADFDPNYPDNTVVSRPYWLLENEDVAVSVKSGLALHPREDWYFESQSE